MQAWSGKYKGKNTGNLADLGCFSIQNSKHLPSGEGGAVVGNDEKTMDLCRSFHDCGRQYGSISSDSRYPVRGANFRMQHIRALILMPQLQRFENDARTRENNATYPKEKLQDIPGILSIKLVDGAEKSSYHLFPYRYKKEHFNMKSRDSFLKFLRAEGIPCPTGYGAQNKDGLIEEALNSRGYQRLYGKKNFMSSVKKM